MYDRATEAWTLVFSVVKTLQRYRGCGGMFSRMLWAAFCRFFRQMLIASKVCCTRRFFSSFIHTFTSSNNGSSVLVHKSTAVSEASLLLTVCSKL